MHCPDLEELVLIAHGEWNDFAVAEHAALCSTCSAFVAEVRLGEDVAKRIGDVLAPEARRPSRLPNIEGYSSLREIGRGGMGVLYSAVQQASGWRIALKVVRGAG